MPPKRPTSPLFPVSANRPFISRNQDMLTTLRTKYPTFTELESHLSKLDESAARAFVLKIAYPEAARQLQHCIYCHKIYNEARPVYYECQIKHFGRAENGTFTCCGRTYKHEEEQDDWDKKCMKYCFMGPHSVVPWERDDWQVMEGYDRLYEEAGILDDDGRKRWWEEIVKVKDCGKLKCEERMLL